MSTINCVIFYAFFTANKIGKVGLTPTVTLRSLEGTIPGPTGVAIAEIGNGLYKCTYTLPTNTPGDEYTCLFHTTDATVDQQDVPAWREVPQWVLDLINIISSIYATTNNISNWTGTVPRIVIPVPASLPGPGGLPVPSAVTLSDLLDWLRIRLNDLDLGNYSDCELIYCINIGVHETEMKARCNRVTLSTTGQPVVGESTFVTDPIFEVFEILWNGAALNKRSLADAGVSLEDWNSTPPGTPVEWAETSGGEVWVHPAPALAGTITFHGYGVSEDLAGSSDAVGSIPSGFAVSTVLDRAEAEARKMRSTFANNTALYSALMGSWGDWCNRLRDSQRSER